MSSEERIRETLRARVRELAGAGEPVADDEPLVESGLLQSLQLLELIGVVADELGVAVAPGDVFDGHFATIEAIVAFVGRRGGRGA